MASAYAITRALTAGSISRPNSTIRAASPKGKDRKGCAMEVGESDMCDCDVKDPPAWRTNPVFLSLVQSHWAGILLRSTAGVPSEPIERIRRQNKLPAHLQ